MDKVHHDVHAGIDPVGMLNALVATGMDAGEALKTIADQDPKAARSAFRQAWSQLLGHRMELDLSGADWLKTLPEGIIVPYHGSLILTNCRNFHCLPKKIRIEGHAELHLEGSGWDGIVQPPTYEGDSPPMVGFVMRPGSCVYFDRYGTVDCFNDGDWLELDNPTRFTF
jgi:hypothetical protein